MDDRDEKRKPAGRGAARRRVRTLMHDTLLRARQTHERIERALEVRRRAGRLLHGERPRFEAPPDRNESGEHCWGPVRDRREPDD